MAYGSPAAMKSSWTDATQEHGVAADSRNNDYPLPGDGTEPLSRQKRLDCGDRTLFCHIENGRSVCFCI